MDINQLQQSLRSQRGEELVREHTMWPNEPLSQRQMNYVPGDEYNFRCDYRILSASKLGMGRCLNFQNSGKKYSGFRDQKTCFLS